MKQVFGVVMNVAKDQKAIRAVVKRIEEGEDSVHQVNLKKHSAYVFSVKVVEGVCFSDGDREMVVWTAGHFEDEERQVSLWAIALCDGEHEVRVGVQWAYNKALAKGVEMELVFVGPEEDGETRRPPKRRRLPTTELRTKGHVVERRKAG